MLESYKAININKKHNRNHLIECFGALTRFLKHTMELVVGVTNRTGKSSGKSGTSNG